MATANEVIDIGRLRQAIGVVGDDQDDMLVAYRNTAIAVVEAWLDRYIISRTAFRSEPQDFGYSKVPDYLVFGVPDIQSIDGGDDIVLHYRDSTDDPIGKTNRTLAFNLSDDRVDVMSGGRDGIVIYSDSDQCWDSILRIEHPTPAIVCNVGIPSRDIPPPWGDAVALLVRALLDGSSYDEVANHSILSVALGPWKRNAYMESVR